MASTRRHLLSCEGLARGEVEELFRRADAHAAALASHTPSTALAGKAVANLFFEGSTRTRMSFERAAKALGADVLNLSAQGSSVSKGETLLDTARNVDALGPSIVVLRHASSGAAEWVSRHVRCAVVNAGDGLHEHPTQGLLDAYTLTQRLKSLEGKRVVIAGDILHSRVARSNVHCLRLLGARVTLCGPPTLLPKGIEALGCDVTTKLDAALEGADAVMMLRVQLERQVEAMFPSARDYSRLFGLSLARLERLKAGAVILHPGPINHGVELAPGVADSAPSVILEQVTNGVAIRMAVLERCA